MSTIFALASAAGKSGVAIMRISGSQTINILHQLGINPLPKPRMASLRKLIRQDINEQIDEALVLWFPAPNSYTGEDVAELHIHGSQAVITELIQFLSSLDDVRIAKAGEFSRRAFENNKMDLTMVEGISDLIDAQTKIQKNQALRQMSGELEKLYEAWRAGLVKNLAFLEAYIDFPDEDIPQDIIYKILKDIKELVNSLSKHLENRGGEILRNGVYAAIIGAPNVGKSSFINMLAKRDVAIVSDIAGTTRDAIEVHLDIGGYPLIISDTAGLRETNNEIERQGVAIAKNRANSSDITICLFDAQELNQLDASTLAVMGDSSVCVINKSDLVDIDNGFQINGKEVFPISVKTGQGVDKLFVHLQNLLVEYISPSSDPVFTRERHKAHLQETKSALEQFINNWENQSDIELSCEDLRIAARSLGEITGRIDIEELLDEVFSSFCIGK